MNRRKCRPTGRRRRPSAKVTPLVPVLTRDHHMPAAGKRGLPEPAQQPREPYAALAATPLQCPSEKRGTAKTDRWPQRHLSPFSKTLRYLSDANPLAPKPAMNSFTPNNGHQNSRFPRRNPAPASTASIAVPIILKAPQKGYPVFSQPVRPGAAPPPVWCRAPDQRTPKSTPAGTQANLTRQGITRYAGGRSPCHWNL